MVYSLCPALADMVAAVTAATKHCACQHASYLFYMLGDSRLRLVNILFQLLVRPLAVSIDDALAVDAGRVCIVQLNAGLGQALADSLLRLGAAATKTLLQLLEGRGLDKDVPSILARRLDLLDAFHLDVEDDNLL